MPLLLADQAWPPRPLHDVTKRIAEWDAWYVGDPETLASVYGGHRSTTNGRTTGGVVGLARRLWWGRQADQSADRIDSLHVPVAADLARVSADLLYSEPPTLTPATGSTTTQDRLDEYAADGMHDTLATGAEIGAALGGRFHRASWDPASTSRPFLTTVDADAAWPEFEWGRLVAVTFWRVVAVNGRIVRRHLERHELDTAGLGVVYHALHEGTNDRLGHPVPLIEDPTTAAYALRVDADSALTDPRTPGLCVGYIPNQTPNRAWRTHTVGRHLGRSDFDGVEPLMDALDETYASLMRDIRLGKARLIVPSSMLTSNGPGNGAAFNLDREVYEGVNAPPAEDGKQEITPHQFAIRVTDHLETAADQVRRIVSTAGYANATLGDGTDGVMTATEVHARERKSYLTRGRKIRHEKPVVAQLARKMLSIDAAIYGTPGLDWLDSVTVDFADTVQDSALSMASTAQALRTAQAASTQTLVQMVHPDWDDTQVGEEVERIMQEAPAALPDPFAFQG